MNTSAHNKALGADKAITQARDFLAQYYSDTAHHDKPELAQADREREVLQQIRSRLKLKLPSLAFFNFNKDTPASAFSFLIEPNH